MKLLLVTPPLTQLNTPYPATAYLTGYLRHRGHDVAQADASLLWTLRLFSAEGLRELADAARAHRAKRPPESVAHFRKHQAEIITKMPIALEVLQGGGRALVHRVARGDFFPRGPRTRQSGPAGHEAEYMDWAFGAMGLSDRARHLASVFVEEVGDSLRDAVDPHFGFGRYADRLAESTPTFDGLLAAVEDDRAWTARSLAALTDELLAEHEPDVLGFTLPFPGNVLGALRMARAARRRSPNLRIVCGGGYVNTELRELREPRFFDFFDAVTYDDGERPLELLLEHFAGKRARGELLRTRVRENGKVLYVSNPREADVPFAETPAPTYAGLPLERYLGIIDLLNPMHRLWSDTRWNKLTVAHGCYWKKCTFCDITLPYIADYEPLAAKALVDRMEALIDETGDRGFHFVDEAAPPKALLAMADEIVRRGLSVSWWGNIRFEAAFTRERCARLAASGCVAVTGGLESASNRLLALMDKGVSVEQVARVTKAFTDAGVLVHAYLMYGFPTQTEAETIDSLERVRQLFAAGCLDSAYWHRFSATAHAPIGLHPERYGVRLLPAPDAPFARNDLAFVDPTGCDHAALGAGLAKAVYNYMHGLGLDDDVRGFFEQPVGKPRVPRNLIARALAGEDHIEGRAPLAAERGPPRGKRRLGIIGD